MFTVIFGGAIAILLIALGVKFKNYAFAVYAFTLSTILVLSAILVIAVSPIHGFGERVLAEEVSITFLTINGEVEMGEIRYVSVSNAEVYCYKVSGDTKISVLTKKQENISCIESEECTRPVLRIYERKAKNSLFNFSVQTKKEYEFYIPLDGVQEIS